jgi:hypothetical protein
LTEEPGTSECNLKEKQAEISLLGATGTLRIHVSRA